MANRKTVEYRFAEIVQEMGLAQAEAALRLIKRYATKPEPRRKKSEKPVVMPSMAS